MGEIARDQLNLADNEYIFLNLLKPTVFSGASV